MAQRAHARPDAGRILESAGRVFARRGYARTSLRQLIAAARVSTTAFYARFESKEQVLGALVMGLLDQLDQRARDELAHATGLEDGVARGVRALVEVLGPQRELVRTALTEAAIHPEVSAAMAVRHRALAALLASQIELLAARGAVAVVDPEAVAWSLVGALHLQVVRWAVWGQLETDALDGALHAVAGAHLPALRPLAGGSRRRGGARRRR